MRKLMQTLDCKCGQRFIAPAGSRCECGEVATPAPVAVRPAVATPPPSTGPGVDFANRHPSLNLLRGCSACNRIIADINGGNFEAKAIARRIVHNANRDGLRELGATRDEQQAAIDAELRSIAMAARPVFDFDPLSIRSTDARDDATIVTTHYNACGYESLRNTERPWRPTLPQKPVCYELVFDDDAPEIEGSVVIRGTRAKNLMWQKEPLLNLALRDCKTPYFAWCDHDMIPDSPSWLSEGIELLNDATHAVQLFDSIRYLNRDGSVHFTQDSCTRAGRARGRCNPGGMWLAKTDWLRSVGGFDVSHIVGAGDVAFLRRHRAVCGVRPGTISHLWHGSPGNRQYSTRLQILRKHNYRHGRDTRINGDGILEWCSDKPELHAAVRQFFEGRREDG